MVSNIKENTEILKNIVLSKVSLMTNAQNAIKELSLFLLKYAVFLKIFVIFQLPHIFFLPFHYMLVVI